MDLIPVRINKSCFNNYIIILSMGGPIVLHLSGPGLLLVPIFYNMKAIKKMHSMNVFFFYKMLNKIHKN